MPEQHEINEAIRHILIARYLLAKADEQGITHGEKHHLHEVIGMETILALRALGHTTITRQNLSDWELQPHELSRF